MHVLSKNTKSLCLLIIILMGIVMQCFNLKLSNQELGYALSHHVHSSDHTQAHHEFLLSHEDIQSDQNILQIDSKNKPLNDIEHKIFHIIECMFNALIMTVLTHCFRRFFATTATDWSFSFVLPHVDLELPFRPPQRAISI